MQIQISWLQKPTDLDLHCLQQQGYPGSAGQGLKVLHEKLLVGTKDFVLHLVVLHDTVSHFSLNII